MRVIVTRPESEARSWTAQLRGRGFEVLELPLIDILPAPAGAGSAAVWPGLAGYAAVMFVSANAVRHFFVHAPAQPPWPQPTRAWAPGAGTRQALLDAGVAAALVDAPPPQAPQFDSETLWEQVALQVAPGQRVLIVRGGDAGQDGGGRDWLSQRLQQAGVQVESVVAYLRARPAFDARRLAQAREAAGADWVWLFNSSQAIAHLQQLVPGQDWSSARALATHPRIAQAARQAGFGVVCESRPTEAAVTAALESFR